jgi:Methyltransferase domain
LVPTLDLARSSRFGDVIESRKALPKLARVIGLFSAALLVPSLACLGATLYLGYQSRQRFRRIEAKLLASKNDLKRTRQELRRAETHLAAGTEKIRDLLKEQNRALRKQRTELSADIRRSADDLKTAILEANVEAADSIVAATSLSALGLRFPLLYSGWTIDPLMARTLVDLIERRRPRVIVELGSGLSTTVISATLERLGMRETRHIVVDHLPEYLEETARRVAVQQLSRSVEYWLCPLTPLAPGGPEWYGDLKAKLGNTEIDILIVDGPPGALVPQSRRPALPELYPHLSATALVILDDANRKNERAVVDAWEHEYSDFEVTRIVASKGLALLSRKA